MFLGWEPGKHLSLFSMYSNIVCWPLTFFFVPAVIIIINIIIYNIILLYIKMYNEIKNP